MLYHCFIAIVVVLCEFLYGAERGSGAEWGRGRVGWVLGVLTLVCELKLCGSGFLRHVKACVHVHQSTM